jgi:DNA-binding GntR family transcriptional regulator
MTAKQKALKAERGTPVEYARLCHNLVPHEISAVEARRRIDEYTSRWFRASDMFHTVELIAARRDLLQGALEAMQELRGLWSWREDTTPKNKKLLDELDAQIKELSGLLQDS